MTRVGSQRHSKEIKAESILHYLFATAVYTLQITHRVSVMKTIWLKLHRRTVVLDGENFTKDMNCAHTLCNF